MIVFVNKCCEVLPIEDTAKIKIKSKLNTLSYIVTDGKKYRKNSFKSPKNADKEYPIMIVVDKSLKKLFNCGNDERLLELRQMLISTTLCMEKDDDYDFIYSQMRKMKIKTWFINLKLKLQLFWDAAILGKKVIIRKDKLEVYDIYPHFWNIYRIYSSINHLAKKLSKFNHLTQQEWIKLADTL